MKFIFITNHYLDRNIGGPNASNGFIRVFSTILPNMSLVYPDYPNSSIAKSIPSIINRIPFYDKRNKIQKLIDIYRGRLNGYYSFLYKHIKNNHYDVIIIDHSIIWSSLKDVFVESGAKLITIHHNVEKRFLHDNPNPIIYRFPYRKYAEKAESDAVHNSHINLTLTNKDIEEFHSLFPLVKGNFYHLGVLDYRPIVFNPSSHKNAYTFIITGVLSFKQSNMPIIEFLKKYYPILCRIYPNNRLIIAGRNPSTEMIKVCESFPEVQLVKNPPEMTPLLQQARYYICPINMGSGQKTRVADGLRCGLPVLCHEISAFGYEEMKDKGFLFTYNSPESFEKTLIEMTSKTFIETDVIKAYNECFSVESGAKKIVAILNGENIL